MTATYKQDKVKAWIQVNSGKRFYPTAPRSEDVDINDIAHALSQLVRFAGHCSRFYSVLEHSIRCAQLLNKLGYSPLIQMYALLHDASEAYCIDLPRPLKQELPEYIAIEDKVMEAVWEGLRLPAPTEEDYKIVKFADEVLLANEINQLMKPDEWSVNNDLQEYFVDLSEGYNPQEAIIPFIKIYMHLELKLTHMDL